MSDVWKPEAHRWTLWNHELGGYLVQFSDDEWKTVNTFIKEQRAKRKKLNPKKKLTAASKQYELMAMAGEVAVGFCTGRKPDFKFYERHWERKFSFSREDGKTLIVKSLNIERFDAKTHESLYNGEAVLSEIDPEEYKRLNNGREKVYADYYALASVDTTSKFVVLRGMATKEELLAAPLKNHQGQGKERILPNNRVVYDSWKDRVLKSEKLRQDLWREWFHPGK